MERQAIRSPLEDHFNTEILLYEKAYLENTPNALLRNCSDEQHTINVGQDLYLNQNVIHYLMKEGKLNNYLNKLITRGKSSLANFILRLFYLTKLVDLSNALVDFNWLDWMIVSERKSMVDILVNVKMFNSNPDVHQLFVNAIVKQERESFVRLCKLVEKSVIDCKECHPLHLLYMVPTEWIEECWESLKEMKDSEGRNLLMIASMSDNLSLFQLIAKKFGKEALKLTDHRGRNVLHYAAIHGSLSIFKYLLIVDDELQGSSGLSYSCSDIDGYSPLFLASIYDQLEIFEYILSVHSGEISLIEPANHPRKPTCYHLASMYGSIKILYYFLMNKDKYPVEKFKDAKNKYPTLWCTELGLSIYLVDYFMRNGFYYLNSSNITFPNLYAEFGYLEILQYLAKYKDTFTLRQSNQLDCLATAANYGNLRIVKYLIEELNINPENAEYQADKNIAHLSIGSKKKELIEYILQKYPHLALKIDKSGNLPLEYVPLNNLEVSIFKLVLPRRDDFLQTNLKSVQRCLCAACALGRIDIVQYVIEELQIDPNFIVHPYQSPILQASTMGQLECVKYLLEHGADSLINNDGENILHGAAIHGHLDVLEYIESKIPKETLLQLMNQISTAKRSSPVNYAIHCGKASVVEWLIDRGADPNMTTLEGNTFLHGASVVGALEIVKLLVEKYNLSIQTKTLYGLRAVDLAIEHGYFKVAQYLLEKEGSENLGKLVEKLVEKKDTNQRNLLYRIIQNGKKDKGNDREYYDRVLIRILDYLVNGKSLLEEDASNEQTDLLAWVTQNSIPFHTYPISELEKGKYYGFLSAYITNAESIKSQTFYESEEFLTFTEPTPFTITVENERESKESLLLNREREAQFLQIKEFGKTGSQGKVFIFYHIPSKRLFVFKFYKFDDSGLSTTKFDEFKMMEKCRYHPNIVTCLSLVKSKTILKDCDPECLVMEYMNGGTLRDEIETFHEKLIYEYSPSKFAIHLLSLISDVTIHMMNAFIHIHERHSMIHRDIKPENILIHFTNDLKYYVLGDFGLARIVDAQFSTSYGNGTPRYQSPSVLKHNYGKEVDFWSLGCTLIEVILNPLTTIHNYRESREECFRLLKGKCEYYDNCLACVENFEHFRPFSMFFKLIQKMVDEKLSATLSATNILLENPFLVKSNLLTLNYFGQNFPMIIEEKDIYESMKERFKDLEIPFSEINSSNEEPIIIVEEIDEMEKLRRENEKMKKMLEQLGLKF